jgi:hypothetical protein
MNIWKTVKTVQVHLRFEYTPLKRGVNQIWGNYLPMWLF